MSDPGEERLSPGEEHLLKDLTVKQWVFEKYLLEWKALYAGAGLGKVSDRQAYLDAQRVVSSEGYAQVIPGDEDEIYQRALLFHSAFERWSEALQLLMAEVSLERGPEELNRALERSREMKEGDEPD
jgi:hypothetical protein